MISEVCWGLDNLVGCLLPIVDEITETDEKNQMMHEGYSSCDPAVVLKRIICDLLDLHLPSMQPLTFHPPAYHGMQLSSRISLISDSVVLFI